MNFVFKQSSYPVSPLESQSPGSSDNQVPKTPSTSIDLGIKRRGNIFNDSKQKGTPFIGVRKERSVQPKKCFFRDDEEDETENLKEICFTKARKLSQQQCSRVCNELHISPPTINILNQFIESINSTDSHSLSMILTLIDKQNQVKGEQLGMKQPGISESTLIDCRYKIIDSPLCSTVLEKTVIGSSPFDTSFEMPKLPPDMHVVLQCFISDGTRQGICFPSSLRVFANGVQIKSPGYFPFPILDLSKYNQSCTIRIVCSQEAQPFLIEAMAVQYTEYSKIIENIRNLPPVEEKIEPGTVSLLDPITGRLMNNPCRGIECQHNNCFEMKTFLKISNSNHKWYCPICKQHLPLDKLIFSHRTYEMIRMAISTQETTPPSFPTARAPHTQSLFGDDTTFDEPIQDSEWYF